MGNLWDDAALIALNAYVVKALSEAETSVQRDAARTTSALFAAACANTLC